MNSLSVKMNMKRKLLMLWTLRSECKKAAHYFLLIHSKQELRALLHKWGTEAITRNIWKQKNKKCPIYTIKRKEIHCSLSLWAINVFILIYVQGKKHCEDHILLMHWVASYLIMKKSNIVLKCTRSRWQVMKKSNIWVKEAFQSWRNLIQCFYCINWTDENIGFITQHKAIRWSYFVYYLVCKQ